MRFEILSLETARKLRNYNKLEKKYNKLKEAYEEILKELKRLERR